MVLRHLKAWQALLCSGFNTNSSRDELTGTESTSVQFICVWIWVNAVLENHCSCKLSQHNIHRSCHWLWQLWMFLTQDHSRRLLQSSQKSCLPWKARQHYNHYLCRPTMEHLISRSPICLLEWYPHLLQDIFRSALYALAKDSGYAQINNEEFILSEQW